MWSGGAHAREFDVGQGRAAVSFAEVMSTTGRNRV